jgi:hypothetical protein
MKRGSIIFFSVLSSLSFLIIFFAFIFYFDLNFPLITGAVIESNSISENPVFGVEITKFNLIDWIKKIFDFDRDDEVMMTPTQEEIDCGNDPNCLFFSSWNYATGICELPGAGSFVSYYGEDCTDGSKWAVYYNDPLQWPSVETGGPGGNNFLNLVTAGPGDTYSFDFYITQNDVFHDPNDLYIRTYFKIHQDFMDDYGGQSNHWFQGIATRNNKDTKHYLTTGLWPGETPFQGMTSDFAIGAGIGAPVDATFRVAKSMETERWYCYETHVQKISDTGEKWFFRLDGVDITDKYYCTASSTPGFYGKYLIEKYDEGFVIPNEYHGNLWIASYGQAAINQGWDIASIEVRNDHWVGCYGQPQQICLAQSGNTCLPAQTCSGSWTSASDTPYCCLGICIDAPTCTDSDGDGYGNPAAASCTFPELDCDDSRNFINPGESEICEDGFDNDCAGGDSVCSGSLTERLSPNQDVGVSWSVNPSGLHYSVLDEPDLVPITTSDFISAWNHLISYSDIFGFQDAVSMQPADIVNEVKVNVYGGLTEAGFSGGYYVNLYIGGAWLTRQLVSVSSTPSWHSTSFSGSWTKQDIDNMQINIELYSPSDVGVRIYALNSDVDYMQSVPCSLTSAQWSSNLVTEGAQVQLNVNGLNCDGKEIKFNIYEDDLFGGNNLPITQPVNAFFSGNTATGSWIAKYQPDGLFGGLPDYYFIAKLVEDESVSVISSNLLGVNKIFINNCGNNLCELNESEDISNCPQDCLNRFGAINYGNNYPSGAGDALNNMQYIGLNLMRWNVYWEDLEPLGDGNYNFDQLEADMNFFKNSGFQILATIITRNSNNYDSSLCGTNPVFPAGCPPADYAKYHNFIYSFTIRFKEEVSYIQIDNEIEASKYWAASPADYIPVINEAYATVKEADLKMPVVFAGISSGLQEQLINNNLYDSSMNSLLTSTDYNVIDLHFYDNYATIDDKINWFKTNGYSNKVFISTENAGPTNWGCLSYTIPPCPNINYASQSEELVKRFAIGFKEGLTKINWFSFLDLMNEDCPFKCSGLINLDWSSPEPLLIKKPVYYAYKLFISKIGNFISVEKISEGIYKFNLNTKSIIVAWHDGGTINADLSAHFATSKVKVTNIVTGLNALGNPIYPVDEFYNPNSIPLDNSPVFIEECNTLYKEDINCDECVDITEINGYGFNWLNGDASISQFEITTAIDNWIRGVSTVFCSEY